MIPLEVPRAVKFTETESRLVVPRGWGRADGEWLFDGTPREEKILEMDGGDGCTTVEMDIMPLNCILKNYLNGTFYIMYFYHSERESLVLTKITSVWQKCFLLEVLT